MITMLEGPWLCETVYGFTKLILALRDQFRPCENDFGLARSILALQHRLWSFILLHKGGSANPSSFPHCASPQSVGAASQ